MCAAVTDHSTHQDLPSRGQESPTAWGSTTRQTPTLKDVFPATRLIIILFSVWFGWVLRDH